MKNIGNTFNNELGLTLLNNTGKLSKYEKEVIKMLRNKGVIITDNKRKIIVSSGANKKNVTVNTLCQLVNKGLILNHTKDPFCYVLSKEGKIIVV